MPSPKAVLRDINDLRLDPKQAYKQTSQGGRLTGVAVDRKHPDAKLAVAHPKPVKSALVELPAEPKPEPVVEEVKAPEAAVVEEVVVAEEHHTEQPKKKDKPVKKAAKKDEPEEPPVS